MQVVSLTLQTKTTDGKTLNTKITYVNPQVSNQLMNEFATKLNEFTVNTYSKVTKTMEETL